MQPGTDEARKTHRANSLETQTNTQEIAMNTRYHFDGQVYYSYADLATAYHSANGYYPIGRYKPGLGYYPAGVAGVAGARQAPGVYRQEGPDIYYA